MFELDAVFLFRCSWPQNTLLFIFLGDPCDDVAGFKCFAVDVYGMVSSDTLSMRVSEQGLER